MSSILKIYINDTKFLKYDKNTRMPEKQRTNYVAMSLFYVIKSDSEGMIAATCAYLANRVPELKQVRAVEHGEEITLDLIFDVVN